MTAPMPVYTGTLLAPEPWVQDAACVEVAPDTWGGLTPRQRKRISHTPTCRTCGAPIGHLSKQHRYCETCAVARRAETKRAYEQKGAA